MSPGRHSIFDDHQKAGNHEIVWDGKANNGDVVNSGIYLYQMKTNSVEIIKRCALLK
ncbi:MAG: hypothetical protein B6244_11175 [Candidatus Cloacimonetes bacterium 4572_55]|nr:MAG: hypothetical protein B6244_11175 [Candidatus Cloacimonetes bacterium 4572_55]